LTAAVHERAHLLGREAYLIAECDLNDVRIVQPRARGGMGCDAVWNDNFHHALHVLLTGERDGYYQDFGAIADLAKAYSEAFVYSGQYSPFRRRRYGNPARGTPAERFVVCAQNHDQIGNRMEGDRLSALTDFESLKLAAGAVLLSPFLPLLFMGEEYAETAPFLYFTSHGDPTLIEAVRRGRREEFAAFSWQGEVPDPQDEETFRRCRLTREDSQSPTQRLLRDFYRELFRLRRQIPALSDLAMERCRAIALGERTLLVHRWHDESAVLFLLNFATCQTDVRAHSPAGRWVKVLHSADPHWDGIGDIPTVLNVATNEYRIALEPRSFVLYERL
jgi:maltooligosyltrehalose trehalohydrolase